MTADPSYIGAAEVRPENVMPAEEITPSECDRLDICMRWLEDDRTGRHPNIILLVGPAGSGKSRLMELLQTAACRRRDGREAFRLYDTECRRLGTLCPKTGPDAVISADGVPRQDLPEAYAALSRWGGSSLISVKNLPEEVPGLEEDVRSGATKVVRMGDWPRWHSDTRRSDAILLGSIAEFEAVREAAE